MPRTFTALSDGWLISHATDAAGAAAPSSGGASGGDHYGSPSDADGGGASGGDDDDDEDDDAARDDDDDVDDDAAAGGVASQHAVKRSAGKLRAGVIIGTTSGGNMQAASSPTETFGLEQPSLGSLAIGEGRAEGATLSLASDPLDFRPALDSKHMDFPMQALIELSLLT